MRKSDAPSHKGKREKEIQKRNGKTTHTHISVKMGAH